MPKNRGNSQLKRIYYRKIHWKYQFPYDCNSHGQFSTLFHAGCNIIEYSMKKPYYVRVPYSLEIRRLFVSSKLFEPWVYETKGFIHFLLQLQTNTGFHTSTVKTRRLFETSFFIRENTLLAVLLKFSHCEIYRKVPVRGNLWLKTIGS